MNRAEHRETYIEGKEFKYIDRKKRDNKKFTCPCTGTGYKGYNCEEYINGEAVGRITVGKTCLPYFLERELNE